MDWIAQGISSIIEFFKTIIDWLNPNSDNFIFIKIIKMIEEVFVPNEEKTNEIIGEIRSRFEFVDGIKASVTSLEDVLTGIKPAPSLSINIGGTKYTESRTVKIIDLSWYAPYKGIGDAVLTGFIYLSFLWRLFINLPAIINGAGGSIQAGYQVEEIQAYNKFGFGRSSSIQPKVGGKNK